MIRFLPCCGGSLGRLFETAFQGRVFPLRRISAHGYSFDPSTGPQATLGENSGEGLLGLADSFNHALVCMADKLVNCSPNSPFSPLHILIICRIFAENM